MKVSVIVPVYKAEAYIETCARSLLAQTCPDIEYIFVDDGCPDRTVEILQQVLETSPRPSKVLHRENGGVPQARLTGLRQAAGEYVFFVDADDWVEPDTVETLLQAAEQNGADMAYCQVINETASGTYISKDPDLTSCRDAARSILQLRMHGYMCNKLIRRSLFTPELFFPSLNMHEDVVIMCQCLFNGGKCVMVPRPLYHYCRTNANSVSRVDKQKRDALSARNFLQLYEWWKDRLPGSPIEGMEPYILVRSAWLAWKNDRDIFKEYPYLAREAFKVPVSGHLRVKLHRQLILKCVLRKFI